MIFLEGSSADSILISFKTKSKIRLPPSRIILVPNPENATHNVKSKYCLEKASKK
jgi:hypothetical protein